MPVAGNVKVFTQLEGERGKLAISLKVLESPRDSILKAESKYEKSLWVEESKSKWKKMPELGRKVRKQSRMS